MRFLKKRIEYLFASAKIGINNAKGDPHISEVPATRGFDEVRLNEGIQAHIFKIRRGYRGYRVSGLCCDIYEAALNLVLKKRKKISQLKY
ncbi:MAG: hypothetical protein GY757_23015 [bacterium]|nr:hypothetical protein [bacterium]